MAIEGLGAPGLRALNGFFRRRNEWDHTVVAQKRAEALELQLSLPSLGRDSQIDQHTYVGSGREILLIDTKQDLKLKNFIEAFEAEVQQRRARGENPRSFLLNLAYSYVSRQMKTNQALSQEVARKYADKPIPLGYFVDQGGVCRHKNLVLALILEKAKEKGWISGKVSIDRATDTRLDAAHAWVRYVNSRGEVIILDTLLQQRPVSLDETVNRQASANEVHFDYRRPEDKNHLKQIITRAFGFKWRS